MIFGETPLHEAEGAILAHSTRWPGGAIKKGARLTAADAAALRAAGFASVQAARLEPGDVHEDEAAATGAAALRPPAGVHVSAPHAGRVNLYAEAAGVLRVDAGSVAAFNGVDEAVTLATLPDFARLSPRQMIATVKIIPYAVSGAALARAGALMPETGVFAVHPFRPLRAALIVTRAPGQTEAFARAGAEAIQTRLRALGAPAPEPIITAHEAAAVAQALAAQEAEIYLVLGGSAASDRRDAVPRAMELAGGRIIRVGAPVDPGNLMAMGDLRGRPVVALPSCARSPKPNGADAALERLYAGLPFGAAEMAALGAGGLLTEISSRPSPRAGAMLHARPRVGAVLLAAGASSRMRGEDKLLKEIEGEPLLRRAARRLAAAGLDEIVVVLGHAPEARRAALDGLKGLRFIEAPRWREGMAASLTAGLAALSPETDAALVAFGDMPDVDAPLVRRVIAAFSPEDSREIIRPRAASGRPGHPALFGRRFFEALQALKGDEGARALIAEHPDRLHEIRVEDESPVTDLDSPEDWAARLKDAPAPGLG